MKYLLSQSKLFRHFLGDARASPPPAAGAAAAAASKKGVAAAAAAATAKAAPDSATKRRRLTEKEEDAQLLRSEEAALPPTTRLSVQPSNIKGQMRPYQLEGLNFLISLFERGVNGILADEMGLVRLGRRGDGAWGRGGELTRGGVLHVECVGSWGGVRKGGRRDGRVRWFVAARRRTVALGGLSLVGGSPVWTSLGVQRALFCDVKCLGAGSHAPLPTLACESRFCCPWRARARLSPCQPSLASRHRARRCKQSRCLASFANTRTSWDLTW